MSQSSRKVTLENNKTEIEISSESSEISLIEKHLLKREIVIISDSCVDQNFALFRKRQKLIHDITD